MSPQKPKKPVSLAQDKKESSVSPVPQGSTAPSLHEIEKAMTALWLNRKTRDWLRHGADDSETPEEFTAVNPAISAEIDLKGAGVYARSLNYELQDMADCIFPYCAKAVGKDWEALVADYYKHYPSQNFDFNQICVNFSTYLQKNCASLLAKYPYLAELADYEWLEQAKAEEATRIELGDNIAITGVEQITAYCPVVNQTLLVRRYKFPISEIADNFENRKRPLKKFAEKACILAIYRDPETHRCRYMALGEATAAVVEAAQKNKLSYQDLLMLTLSLTPEIQPADAVVQFLNLLEGLQNDNLFVGSQKKEV